MAAFPLLGVFVFCIDTHFLLIELMDEIKGIKKKKCLQHHIDRTDYLYHGVHQLNARASTSLLLHSNKYQLLPPKPDIPLRSIRENKEKCSSER